MLILGINNMHDASAALVSDGEIVAAAEEERFTRVKHTKGFPENAIRFCLDHAGATIRDVDVVCASWKPWVLGVRALLAVKSVLTSTDAFRAKASRGAGQMRGEWAELFRLRKLVETRFGKGRYRIEYVDHHLAHAASVFLGSPFERAAILTVDGAGESHTTVLSVGEGRHIRTIQSVSLPHSLGQFYSAVTAFLGFTVQSDEYKVMGLAAYGEPVHADYLRKNFIRFHHDGLFSLDTSFIDYHLARNGIFHKRTTDVFGPPRKAEDEVTKQHMDVAASAQAIIEDALFSIANRLHRETALDSLCLAGGVAFNCVANGKLLKETPFKNIYIQPAAGDAGGALGAALLVAQRGADGARKTAFTSPYLGPSYSPDECEAALREKGLSFEKLPEEVLAQKTAQELSNGKLVCWFQGRMEWGPRALGARSLIADPRRAEMKDIINAKVKQREMFRPFAPSILSEHARDIFEYYHDSPYMIFTFPVKKEWASRIPAVVHVDNTARPQAVFRETNKRYWEMISAFHRITGVPLVLNTSFNVQEPIVCTPRQAVATFLSTQVDYLVLDDYMAKLP